MEEPTEKLIVSLVHLVMFVLYVLGFLWAYNAIRVPIFKVATFVAAMMSLLFLISSVFTFLEILRENKND